MEISKQTVQISHKKHIADTVGTGKEFVITKINW